MIKLIILDGYGVVFFGGYKDTCKIIADYFGLNYDLLYDILYTKYFNLAAEKKITQKEAWVNAIKEWGLSFDWKEVRQLHYDHIYMNKELLPFIKKWKRTMKVMLLSKNTRSQFADAEKQMHFRKYFDDVINTWELGLPKASKKTYEFIMKKHNVKAEEILLVDDQQQNLDEAKKIGINTLLFSTLDRLENEIKKINKNK